MFVTRSGKSRQSSTSLQPHDARSTHLTSCDIHKVFTSVYADVEVKVTEIQTRLRILVDTLWHQFEAPVSPRSRVITLTNLGAHTTHAGRQHTPSAFWWQQVAKTLPQRACQYAR